MSCHFDLWCKTCEDDAGLHINHGERRLLDLLKHRAAFEGLTDAAIDAYAEASTEGRVDTDALRFFPRHKGHEVVVRDEYGRESGRCGEWVDCPTCGHAQPCALKAGHEGGHAPRDGGQP